MTTSFRGDIEGLRAIAILAVVGYHYGLGIQGGFVGVDIFFVISGYLITGLLTNELRSSGRIDLLKFYGRRARRLLPAFFPVVVVSLVVGAIIFSPIEQGFVSKAAGAASLYVSNLYFLRQYYGYFSPESGGNPFLHTWSLSVEEQFYLLWPAFLLLLRRPRSPRLLVSGVVASTLLSFAFCLWLTSIRQPLAFYGLPTRIWEFGLGALAGFLPVSVLNHRPRISSVLAWGGLAMLLLSCVLPYDLSLFPGPEAMFAAVAASLVLITGAARKSDGTVRLLRTKPLLWLGARSYSIYLWHWPILVCALVILPEISPVERFACAVLTLVCALFSFKYLEHPLRTNPWLGQKVTRSLALGISLSVASVLLASMAALFAMRFSASPNQARIAVAKEETSIANGDPRECLSGFTDSKAIACDFGSPTATRTLVLFGDSHADQWSTPLVALVNENSWRLITFLKSSCSAADIPNYNIRLHRMSGECADWRASALQEIIKTRPTAVILTEFSSGYIKGPIASMGDRGVELSAWSSGLRRTIDTLQAAGIPVVLLRDSPAPDRNIANCLARADWHSKPMSSCDTPKTIALNPAISDAEKATADSLPGVHYVDMSSTFCDQDVCPPMRNGYVVYRDANHLATRYAAELLHPLELELLPVIERLSESSGSYAR